jgi:hypothetical protein
MSAPDRTTRTARRRAHHLLPPQLPAFLHRVRIANLSLVGAVADLLLIRYTEDVGVAVSRRDGNSKRWPNERSRISVRTVQVSTPSLQCAIVPMPSADPARRALIPNSSSCRSMRICGRLGLRFAIRSEACHPQSVLARSVGRNGSDSVCRWKVKSMKLCNVNPTSMHAIYLRLVVSTGAGL